MTEREVITLDSDSDEDEDLRRAIQLSLQDQDTANEDDSASRATQDEAATKSNNPVAFGSLNLDRKQMEEERLKRLGKRRRSSGGNDASIELPVNKRPTLVEAPTESKPQVRFPEGVVKRTFARGYPRTSDDIKIEELLQKDELQLALLSSFQWDEEWLLSKLNVEKTRVLLLAYAASEDQKELMRQNVPHRNIRFCFPPMHGPGSMHSKLQLLKYPNYLRLVIPTGNLVPYDWGETGVMENMVFVIDLPRAEDADKQAVSEFGDSLFYFLKASGVDDGMIKSLSNYNFDATKNLGFVFSIPGGHTGNARDRVGYCGLGKAVRDLNLATKTPIDVDLVCASLGSVNCDLVNAIYNACQGDNGMQEYSSRSTRKSADKDGRPSQNLRDRFRIYFPTNDTISISKGGKRSAGTICLQAKWWRMPTFPRELVRDCINNRNGLLMHSKAIFVRSGEEKGRTSDASGWAYVGSANLSESAWGRLVKEKSTGSAKMSCRNWECGIVIPAKAAPRSEHSFSIFSGTVPVPMEVPGRPYRPNDEPWFFMGD